MCLVYLNTYKCKKILVCYSVVFKYDVETGLYSVHCTVETVCFSADYKRVGIGSV